MDGVIRKFSGVRATRVIDRSGAIVPEHAHPWPVLSLFVMGTYRNRTAGGEHAIDGPSAILYRGGETHANVVGTVGFEQLEIEFDPHWLGLRGAPGLRTTRVLGGPLMASMHALAAAWTKTADERMLRRLTRDFITAAARQEPARKPTWLGPVARRLAADPSATVATLAAELDMHAGWLGEAYRHITGEGLRERALRHRVERAACRLRESDLPCARIAAEAGFFDQSHMAHAFRKLLNRTPGAVRRDRNLFRHCERGGGCRRN